MTLDDKNLRGLIEHERLKPINIRMSQENVQDIAQSREIMNSGLNFTRIYKSVIKSIKILQNLIQIIALNMLNGRNRQKMKMF